MAEKIEPAEREQTDLMCRVFGDVCDELGCEHDNEAALAAVAALRERAKKAEEEREALEAAFRAGFKSAVKDVYSLHEDTVEKYHDIRESDTDGKMGAFARGRIAEAKSIARAMGDPSVLQGSVDQWLVEQDAALARMGGGNAE